MLTLPPRFQEEAEKPDPRPFALLEIQSKGQSAEATSEADWGGNVSESNVDYTSTPPNAGDVILAAAAGTNITSKVEPTSTIGNSGWQGGYNTYDKVDEYPPDDAGTYIISYAASTYTFVAGVDLGTVLSSIPSNAFIKEIKVTSRSYASGISHNVTGYNLIRVSGSDYVIGVGTLSTSYVTASSSWTTHPVSGVAWTKETLLSDLQGIGVRGVVDSLSNHVCTMIYLEITYYDFQTSGSIVCQLDLGVSANIANPTTISIDDNVPTGAGMTYTIEGSVTLSPWAGVVLGAVEDGSSVAGYRFYRVTTNFTSDGSATGVLRSIVIEIPDRIYKFTSFGEPILGALPYLVSIPGRTISIDLKDFITVGSDQKAQLQKDDFVVQMLRENHFKNLHASIQMGMYREGITENDLVYTGQGLVSGYSVGMDTVSVHIKDASKDLSVKWPQGSGVSTPPAVSKDGTHLVDIINTIIDDVGIAARYLSRGSLATLKADVGDGTPATANFVAYRGSSPPVATGDTTITEPETAKKVIGEILLILGAYLVSQEDGRMYFIEYDNSDAARDTWDKDDFDTDPTYNPAVESLSNAVYVYFDWNGSGQDASNFASLLIDKDAGSIADWQETSIRIIKSKWIAGSASDGYYGLEIATHVGARETARRTNGMGTLPVKTGLDKFRYQVGDMIEIDASELIINPDVGEGDVRKFMITSKTPDWGNNSISWELMEAR